MNTDPTLIATFFVILALNGVLVYLLPRLTRPDLYFAVTVPPDFRDSAEGARILRQYRLEVWIHSLIALGLLLLSLRVGPIPALLLAGLFWQVLGCFLAYLRGRARVMPHAVPPATLREADLSPRPARFPGGWPLQLGPFAILAATAVWLRLHWEQIPERFPVHWGVDGKPNGWATRSLAGVFGPLLVAASVCAGIALLAYAISTMSRRIQVRGGPGKSEARFQRTMLSILLGTEYFLALLFAWVGLLALRSQPKMPAPLAVLVPALALAALVVVLMVRMGQGGSRLPEYLSIAPPSEHPSAAQQPSAAQKPSAARQQGGSSAAPLPGSPVGDRTLDRSWLAGVIYINRNDPAIIVEKRFGLGYTLNLGQPVSWLIIALLVLVPLALIFLVRPH